MLKKVVVVGLLLGLGVVVSFAFLLDLQVNRVVFPQNDSLYRIEKGQTVTALAEQLIKEDILKHKWWLKVFVKLNPEYGALKAGTYAIPANTSLKTFLSILASGKEHEYSITFIEGTTIKEWLVQLASNKHIKQTLSGKDRVSISQFFNITQDNSEGWFFPDTYQFTEQTTDLAILKRAHQKMKQSLEQLWNNRAKSLPYQTPYQALIMASIVEKESAQLSEKPLIASVFVNRLNKKMRLQTDPTVIYGLGERYQGNITRKHLREKTAYNTYRINGLPPTPIAMPGLAALQAVMHPAESNYFYFVSKGDGHHVFSTNLADHNRAVAHYQLGKK